MFWTCATRSMVVRLQLAHEFCKPANQVPFVKISIIPRAMADELFRFFCDNLLNSVLVADCTTSLRMRIIHYSKRAVELIIGCSNYRLPNVVRE